MRSHRSRYAGQQRKQWRVACLVPAHVTLMLVYHQSVLWNNNIGRKCLYRIILIKCSWNYHGHFAAILAMNWIGYEYSATESKRYSDSLILRSFKWPTIPLFVQKFIRAYVTKGKSVLSIIGPLWLKTGWLPTEGYMRKNVSVSWRYHKICIRVFKCQNTSAIFS